MEGKLPVTCFSLSILNAAAFAHFVLPDYSTHKGQWVYRLAIQQFVLQNPSHWCKTVGVVWSGD